MNDVEQQGPTPSKPGLIAAAVVGALICGGTLAYFYKHGLSGFGSLTDAKATILGSMIGAAISIWGAYYVSTMNARERNREFEGVAGEFVDSLRFEAYLLNRMCIDYSPFVRGDEERCSVCRWQAAKLEDSVQAFDYQIGAMREGNFDLRWRIAKLRHASYRAAYGLSGDVDDQRLLTNLRVASQDIAEACDAFWLRNYDLVEKRSRNAVDDRIRQFFGR